MSLLPAFANLAFNTTSFEFKQKLFRRSDNWFTAFYLLAGFMLIAMLALCVMFATIIIMFEYEERGYYPSVAWCFMQLYLLSVSAANGLWWFSCIMLVYDYRRYYI